MLALLGAGCGTLDVEPGSDLAVRLLAPAPIPAVAKITVPVRFAVAGCDAFDVAVTTGTAGTSVATRAVDVRRDGEALVADVPVEWIRAQDPDACVRSLEEAVVLTARLDVTCRDAGRVATAEVAISYATADVVHRLGEPSGLVGAELQYLFASGDPLQPFALLPSSLQAWADLEPRGPAVPFGLDDSTFIQDELYRPRMAFTSGAYYVTSGCWDGSFCPAIWVSPDVTFPSEHVSGLAFGPLRQDSAWVPAHVLDLAVTASGDVLVLSHATGGELGLPPPDDRNHHTVLSRFTPRSASDGSGIATAEVVGYFPDERVMTRFSRTQDGRLAFLTYLYPPLYPPPGTSTALRVVLHETDGFVDQRTEDVNGDAWVGEVYPGGVETHTRVRLSPDAATMLIGGNQLGPVGENAWIWLPTDQVYVTDDAVGGAAWGPHALALWSGLPLGTWWRPGVLEAFDLSPPHARQFRYEVTPLPGQSGEVSLSGAVAVGDHYVLTTSTGVRVLDREGKLVGGADPLPCHLAPSVPAIASGPRQAAVGVGESANEAVLVFDLSAL